MALTCFPEWAALSAHAESVARLHLRDFFKIDPDRVRRLSLSFGGLWLDYSKQRMLPETLALLVKLAEATGLKAAQDKMFAGEHINATEDRAVLHVALRSHQKVFPSSEMNVMPDVQATRARMAQFAEDVRAGRCVGAQGLAIRDVVNIGIGGSDLGPKMVNEALRAAAHPGVNVHYVSNLDSAQLATLLPTLDARTTLFIVVSKTFTTQETMLNADTARNWLVANLGDDCVVERHFAAVSSRPDRAIAFGVSADRVFPIWDWVGGRFSLWSAVGLALMISVGVQAFEELLAGAESMDAHFRSVPFTENLPVVLALIDIWNTNFMGAESRAVLPYNDSLKYFPSFLQQLEMESNGKTVRLDEEEMDYRASPIVWGELGNNGQHAFFQLLHQGGRYIPCDFILAAHADFPVKDHQEALISNCLAQSAALAFGKTEPEVRASMRAEGASEELMTKLLPHRIFVGNVPSTTLLLDALCPRTLGALVALYEHKVFVEGVIWGVNSFDQWGVELGKAMASKILPAVRNPDAATELDASTQNLLSYCRQHL